MLSRKFIVVAVSLIASVISVATQQVPNVPKALVSAAEKGSAAAQYAVGASLEEQGDVAGAMAWYAKSAAQGYAGAQLGLGRLTEAKIPHGATLEEAIRWYRLAADQGLKEAQDHISRLAAADSTRTPVTDLSLSKPEPTAAATPDTSSPDPERAADARTETLPPSPESAVEGTKKDPAPAENNPVLPVSVDSLTSRLRLALGPDVANYAKWAAIFAAVLFVFFCSGPCVKYCHTNGYQVYAQRRNVVGYALGGIAIWGVASMALPTGSDTLLAIAIGIVWWGLQIVQAQRLNPTATGGSLVRIVLARFGAATVGLVVSWLLILSFGSKPQSNASAAQVMSHEVNKAIPLVILSWIGATYLNFVCYPDPDKYPESVFALA